MNALDRCRDAIAMTDHRNEWIGIPRSDLAMLIALADAAVKARTAFYDTKNKYHEVVSGVMETINPPLAALTREAP